MLVRCPDPLADGSFLKVRRGPCLAICRPFADTNELHIVKKSLDKRTIQDMHAYMVGRSHFWEGWHKTKQPHLGAGATACICKVTDAASLSLSSHFGREPTHQETTSADVLAGRKWRRTVWIVWMLTLLPTTIGFTNYSVFGVKPVLLGVENYFVPLIWLNVFMFNFVTQVEFLTVVIIVCTGKFKVPL